MVGKFPRCLRALAPVKRWKVKGYAAHTTYTLDDARGRWTCSVWLDRSRVCHQVGPLQVEVTAPGTSEALAAVSASLRCMRGEL